LQKLVVPGKKKMSILTKIFGDANKRYLNSIKPKIDKVNELEQTFESFSSEDLKNKTKDFKERLKKGGSLDDLLPEAFALVREGAKRTLDQRHYDVQLVGGMVLHEGRIAEMTTGEGKTLVATLPAYLNALTGKGVHIVTVNDYLSRRDAVWMGQIYDALGLTVGCINHDSSFVYDSTVKNEEKDEERDETGSFKVVHEYLRPVTRKEAYEADITYGTNNEFGFDYLRDNLVHEKEQVSQAQGHSFAIVDEIDSILIDEARTPLIISAPDVESGQLYKIFAGIVPRLIKEEDYTIDEKFKSVSITESGIEKVEKALGIENIYEEGGTRQVHHLQQALRAHALFKKDKDYVVKDGEVIIVDEFTGRLMPGRRWSEGLHQAVEAKENVEIQKESRTFATITFQNYFRLYDKLSGMTGTAETSAEEFDKVYKLDVAVIPTNKEMQRDNRPDRIYKTEKGKLNAVVQEVKERHEKGQPILVGTVSIEKNEMLSTLFKTAGIPHNVLNAKNHEKEAEIIAQAGKVGAVTIATNMAGRGVDIILGGNPYDADEAKKVRESRGLHVIGTGRHEARRIDNQLRGRAGRQGDPGSSQFFVSAEDELIRIFGGDRMFNLMNTLGVPEDQPIEHSFISKSIEQAQSKIEGHHFDARRRVLDFDDVMNKHRKAVYKNRNDILYANEYKPIVMEYINRTIDQVIQQNTNRDIGEVDKENIAKIVGGLFGKENFQIKEDPRDEIDKLVEEIYREREEKMGVEQIEKLNKAVLLRTIDQLWMDHLEQMDYLRESVGLRAYGQRDPLAEYKIEGHKMFDQLLGTIEFQVASMIFRVGIVQQPKQQQMITNKNSEEISQPTKSSGKVGRNDPCPCGSGKKYKKCHGKG
jgi:preprotein translocase subunit SecA